MPAGARGPPCPRADRITRIARFFSPHDSLEPLLAGHDVEADGVLELAQADRAQPHRPSVGLLEVVRAVHQAAEVHAVMEAEHVTRLVRETGHMFGLDRKSTRLNSSHVSISYAVFCLKKKKK